ncbi:MAG: ImmA/IrrE family metallo-endopeptidase [Candidatus Electryonea clarkiae]|nr:ImmA/IrrE family metallo-endopeptidase [Candidatus Electryonea clarkiae]MDP8288576.1 ImmA/IrrE family metallo-endopeptidase [Candidatus Electryonea clarkiae]
MNSWAETFAKNHSIQLRYETPLANNLTAYKYDDSAGAVVVIDSNMPSERQNFALSHETAHILLGHSGEIDPVEEQEANRLASELLLPESEFAPEAWRDLRELRELFSHASFEAIGRRRLAFVDGVLTIVDNGKLTRRLSSELFSAPPSPTKIEWDLILQSFKERRDMSMSAEGIRFSATYVDEGRGVERVLLTGEEA